MQMQLYGFPNSLEASVHFDFTQFTHTIDYYFSHCDSEREVYFYHGDHLGSASWITDNDGIPAQHLQYLPFGEPFVNQRATNYNERYTFTGKERDSETGYSYFGARYYDSDLSRLFLSVDPMADKYPSISPYAYCAWNPLKLVDPNGEEQEEIDTKYYNMKGELLFETNDGMDVAVLVYDEKKLESDLKKMKKEKQLDSPNANKNLHAKYGTLEQHQKKTAGESDDFTSDTWTLYFKTGYNDGYDNKKTVPKRLLYAIIASLNNDPVDSSPQDMNGGYSCGVMAGERARKNGEINLFKPKFKSSKEKIKI